MKIRFKIHHSISLLLVLICLLLTGGENNAFAVQLPRETAILPGDRITVDIFRHDKLSGALHVAIDTSVQHPVLGKLFLGGKSIAETEKMLQGLIANLNIPPETFTVSVQIKAVIMGQVRSPGTYYLDVNNSLNDLLASSGGITADANLEKVIIYNRDRYERIDFLTQVQEGHMDEVLLRSGDTVIVPVKRTLSDSINMISTLVSTVAIIVSLFLLK